MTPEGQLSLKESDEGRSHASVLTVFIEDILKDAGIRAGDLDAVAVSKGPGSYTGLRIGVSVAKGMAYAASIPLIGVETTLFNVSWVFRLRKEKIRYFIRPISFALPSMHAGWKSITLFCDAKGNTVSNIKAEIMDKNSFSEFPESVRIFLFGDGAEKCRGVIEQEEYDYLIRFQDIGFIYV